MARIRPHLLGVDDAPFTKGQPDPVPIVGVTMEGADVVEGVAITEFPVDGAGATEYLAGWITGLRTRDSLQGVVIGGITIAGLGLVDMPALAGALGLPVMSVTRHDPGRSDLPEALRAAGFLDRLPVAERSPKAYRAEDGLFLAVAGEEFSSASAMLRASLGKARLPEPLRLAHLIARALVTGESRGRV